MHWVISFLLFSMSFPRFCCWSSIQSCHWGLSTNSMHTEKGTKLLHQCYLYKQWGLIVFYIQHYCHSLPSNIFQFFFIVCHRCGDSKYYSSGSRLDWSDSCPVSYYSGWWLQKWHQLSHEEAAAVQLYQQTSSEGRLSSCMFMSGFPCNKS